MGATSAIETLVSPENATDTTIVSSKGGEIRGLYIETDGTNEIKVSLRDGSLSGNVRVPLGCKGANKYQGIFYSDSWNLKYYNGLYLKFETGSGTGKVTVYYI